ncbi:hypothetical protein ATCC90586_011033 [Pythium insidiosum]|nr:hypothetical protein ATCC90586_011033 [Pythium insidiosum]
MKLKSAETAYEEVLDMYKRMDAEVESNECLRKVLTNEKTGEIFNSTTVRNGLAGLMRSSSQRAVGLSKLAEVQTCLFSRGLRHRKGHEQQNPVSIGLGEFPEPVTNMSELLYSAIVFSERWAQPAPTKEQRLKFFLDGPFSMLSESEAFRYCVFTGSDEPACKELKDELPATDTEPFFYERDEFFTKPLRLPAGASALIINGGLDFQTPTEFGELLYSKLSDSGNGALMVTFDYGNHCAGEAVADGQPTPCRDSIVSQFVAGDGDINAISLECMNSLPALSFEVPAAPEGETPAEKEAHKKHHKKHGNHGNSKKESRARHA